MVILTILLLFAQTPQKLTFMKIDYLTEQKLVTLFTQKPQKIQLFWREDSTYLVEGLYKNEKVDLELSYEKFHSLMQKPIEKYVILENQRTTYIINQTLLGIGLYSWSLPSFLGAHDEGAVALGLLTPMLWFGGSLIFSNHRNISSAAAYGSFMGGLQGAAHGGFIFSNEDAAFPVSVIENFTDFYIANKKGFPPSVYQRKVNHFLFSYYHYAALTLLVGGDVFSKNDWRNASLLSIIEGYTALFLTNKNYNYLTMGDALFEFRTSMIGAECLPALLLTYDLHREESSNEKIYAITSLIGHFVGYYYGYKLSQKYDLSTSQGILTWLFPYLAHGTTAGLGVLINDNGYWNNYPIIFLGTELALTYFTYKYYAEKPIKTTLNFDRFNFYINPLGFFSKYQKVNTPVFQLTINI